jgi:nucleotide-binding universal stress UspA family protein
VTLRHQGQTVTTRFTTGRVVTRIAQVAREEPIDLIVMASRGGDACHENEPGRPTSW